MKLAYTLNNPLMAVKTEGKGNLPATFSMVTADKANVFTDIVKKAEDSDATIVRLYDAYNMTSKPTLSFGFNVTKAEICDLLENPIAEVPVVDNTVTLTVKPFEIVTLKLS